MGAGQDADAETALRSQIERSPGDQNSRASLGELLLKEKKYAQAATELDKAAILAAHRSVDAHPVGQIVFTRGPKSRRLGRV